MKILVLSGNEVSNAYLNFLPACSSLIKLDLSHNRLSSLPSARLPSLRMLLLKGNQIKDPISLLAESLSYLDYRDNPLFREAGCEHDAINRYPQLQGVNGRAVAVEERSAGLCARLAFHFDPLLLEEWQSQEAT